MKKLKVLLSAYQCGPGMGSVSQIGWEWYARMTARADVTLVTHVRNKAALEHASAPLLGSDVIYIDTEWFAGRLYRLAKKLFPKSEHAVFLLSSLDYLLYDLLAVRQLKRLLKRGKRWDVVHAVTPVTPVAPTSLHKLGLPLALGPLNGGLGQPEAFAEVMKQEAAWLYPVRQASKWLQQLLGGARRADVILTATEATRQSFAADDARCVPMIENGVELARFTPAPWPDFPDAQTELRVLFTGRLIAVKGLPMLLNAIAQVRREFAVRLTVAGDGPMADEWRQQAQTLGLNDCVDFAGAVGLDEVAALMRQSHVFCLPSVRESGGAVLLEAMASARPVIALDYGGPAELVDDTVGCAIVPRNEQSVIEDLAATLRAIIAQPEVWRAKGLAGRDRAERLYSWDAKIDSALELYQRISAGRTNGPDLPSNAKAKRLLFPA